MKPVPVGTKGQFETIVESAHLASEIDPALAAVMSTPKLVEMMERAAMDALNPFYDAGESSVGISIEVKHVAATPPGHRVRAEAEVTKAEGRRFEFQVRAFDEVEEIGSGIHRRAVVNSAKFNEQIKPKVKPG
jgi:fluoroacetyl-CoA thioesterase